ncbi:protein ZINC INDUCED FACILITATOR-LIKE 1-like [Pecten maximus]|uniref:protein ZINC INDUCED FACILITATOR-LIKE 1-like n=1 Tax=Pecten maximus TaxID=6579 RepID=UPI001458979E|nr:protein ZINC INDUCED FACILITATOR-LIKE 1-like [Pecten maximus]
MEQKSEPAKNGVHSNLDANNDDSNQGDNLDVLSRRKSSIWMTIKDKIRVGDKNATPLNWKYVFLVFISLFCSAVSLTFLFPFLPEMVVGFGYAEEDKGYYAGLVASAVFAGRAVGSYFWGWLSDRYGRRPVMMITIFGNGFFSLVFGFTYNLPMAIISRFLTGLSNGTVGTAKTMLYEICDNTNQALGMSIISVAWGAGIVLGPTLGGLLASPVKRYPQSFSANGVFAKFPYLLPSMIIFIICVLVVILDFFLLPETLNSKKNINVKNVEGEEEALTAITNDLAKSQQDEEYLQPRIALSVEDLHCESEAATYLFQKEAQTGHHGILREELRQMLSHDHRKKSLSLCHIPGDTTRKNDNFVIDVAQISKSSHELNISKSENAPVKSNTRHLSEGVEESCNGEILVEGSKKEQPSGCWNAVKNTNIVTLFRMGDVRQAVMVYTIFSFGMIGFEEIFTVWASTEHRFDGLNYAPDKIGAVIGISSVPLLVFNLFLFPYMAHTFGLKKTFGGCTLVLMFAITVMPMLHLIQNQDTLLMVLVILVLLPQKLITACCFSASSLFVNNSAPPNRAGAVNGIAMTMTAIARSLAPAVGGSIFAWSIGYGAEKLGPPFDVNLSFFFFGFVLWTMAVYSIFISDKLNLQKK